MRVPRGAAALVAAVAVVVSGCSSSSYPPKPPPPTVERAPAELAALAIHVHRLVSPPETPEDEWDYQHMSGLTRGLRQAFQLALTRAGYRVVVDRRDPRDLVATLHADWPHDRPGVATLKISARGQVVEQLSTEIPIVGEAPRTQHLEEHAAVSLVHALNASQAVRAFASHRAKLQPLQIAEPAPGVAAPAPASAEPGVAPTRPPAAVPTTAPDAGAPRELLDPWRAR